MSRRVFPAGVAAVVVACSGGPERGSSPPADDGGTSSVKSSPAPSLERCDEVSNILRRQCHMVDDEHGNPGTHNESLGPDGRCDPEIAQCLLRVLANRRLEVQDDCHRAIHLDDEGVACGHSNR